MALAEALGAKAVGEPANRRFTLAIQSKPASARRAEETDDERKKREENEAAEKARKAKRKGGADDTEGDDDSDENDQDDPKIRSARARERKRIFDIMTSDACRAGNVILACHIAMTTATPRRRAIKLIAEMGSAMGTQDTSPQTLADRILRAAARARGEQPAAPYRAPAQGRGPVATPQQIIAAGKKRRGEI
jgi:hypothetical protein